MALACPKGGKHEFASGKTFEKGIFSRKVWKWCKKCKKSVQVQ